MKRTETSFSNPARADQPGARGPRTPFVRSTVKEFLARTETRFLLVFLAGSSALGMFALLTGEILEGDTAAIDRRILIAFRTPGHLDKLVGPRWLQESARDITALGGFTILALISVAAIVGLLAQRRRWQAVWFGASVLIAQGTAEAIKAAAARPRPELVTHFDLVYSSSFPSGHAMMSPVVYLTLAGATAARLTTRRGKLAIISAAIGLVAAIGVSRIYLGVHWPTDVLGGWILGCFLSLCATWVIGHEPGGPAAASC